MAVWQIDIYEGRDDPNPSRRALIEADNEEEATQITKDIIGTGQRATIDRVFVQNGLGPTSGKPIWI